MDAVGASQGRDSESSPRTGDGPRAGSQGKGHGPRAEETSETPRSPREVVPTPPGPRHGRVNGEDPSGGSSVAPFPPVATRVFRRATRRPGRAPTAAPTTRTLRKTSRPAPGAAGPDSPSAPRSYPPGVLFLLAC